MNRRVFFSSDTHGNYLGFKQVLERSNFDYDNDLLIHGGDICDGHIQTFEVVEELLKIKNKILIKGNHCEVWLNWIKTGHNDWFWQQGQLATARSYMRSLGMPEVYGGNNGNLTVQLLPSDIPQTHIDIFKSQIPYYKDEKKRLFIHGGFNRHYLLDDQPTHVFWWDRDLWSQALSFESMTKGVLEDKPKFKIQEDVSEIFIGHTSTQFWEEDVPMKAANIWNLDTGGGWFGKITLINVETKEYWQSDYASELYPEFKGRK